MLKLCILVHECLHDIPNFLFTYNTSIQTLQLIEHPYEGSDGDHRFARIAQTYYHFTSEWKAEQMCIKRTECCREVVLFIESYCLIQRLRDREGIQNFANDTNFILFYV